MDSVATPDIAPSLKKPDKIRAKDLLTAFDQYAPHIRVLSLDCFDTILWRKTATPEDVFFDLQQKPTFKSLGLTAVIRTHAEITARQMKILQHSSTEVNLEEIYRTSFPQLSAKQCEQLIEEEITAEIEACYAFPPIVDLMRKAKSKGIKLVIVSDTYLQENQLRRLLSASLPQDVMAAIDTIFCSSELGRSKVNGLFKPVLEKLNCPAHAILHIGDHPSSDFAAASEQKLHALQLVHHENAMTELLRMRITSASLFNPSIRDMRSLASPFRGILANAAIAEDKPEQLIGYAALGPIMYAFARFILDDVQSLKQAGKNPKLLFLMRDAYLPALACEALAGTSIGKRVRISRFAALAASFRTQEDVDRYLAENVRTYRFKELAQQLLLPKKVSEPLITTAQKSWDSAYEFTKLIHQHSILKMIYRNSANYRARLIRHLQKEIDIESGDTLVFIDLGYSGTAQRLLEPILRDELAVETVGRYLISLGVPGWNASRRGLLDPSGCDERILRTLVAYIALLEQLCTCNEKSVIDYDQHGNPLYSDSTLQEQQHTKLKLIQTECLRFINEAHTFFQKTNSTPLLNELRDATSTELGRLLFLPTESEIQYLQSFHFDLNLGTKDTFSVFDESKGLASLRRRGLFFSFMEKHGKSMRTNYPAELRSAGIELALAFMAHHRFGFDIHFNDLSFRREKINLITVKDNKVSQSTLYAPLTHDGYFSLSIPIGAGGFQVGIRFGQQYQWIQFESAEKIRAQAYLSMLESQYTEDCWSTLIFNDMVDKGGKLYECLTDSSFVMIPPAQQASDDHYIVRITFRPIVSKTEG